MATSNIKQSVLRCAVYLSALFWCRQNVVGALFRVRRIYSLRAGEWGTGKTNRKIPGLHGAAGEGNILVFEFRPFLVWPELTRGRTRMETAGTWQGAQGRWREHSPFTNMLMKCRESGGDTRWVQRSARVGRDDSTSLQRAPSRTRRAGTSHEIYTFELRYNI